MVLALVVFSVGKIQEEEEEEAKERKLRKKEKNFLKCLEDER